MRRRFDSCRGRSTGNRGTTLTTGRLHVDPEDRRVAWRPDPRHLWLRGGTFVTLGLGLPVAVLGGEQPSWLTISVLLVTAATAAWFVVAVRTGWELDEHGIDADIGRRQPTRLGWPEVGTIAIMDDDGGSQLVAVTRDQRHVTIGRGDPSGLRAALDAADRLGLVPTHVAVQRSGAG